MSESRSKREQLVAHLESMKLADFERVAMHGRLETTMRVIDMMLFQAEHDDYHLARIRQLIRWFG